MRFPTRISSYSSATILAILLISAVLFMLFVYPNPTGLPFTLLRLVLVAVMGILFFVLLNTAPERRKGKGPIETPIPAHGDGGTEHVGNKNDQALKGAIQVVLDLIAESFPKFSSSAYLVNRSGTELVQLASSGERNAFRPSLSLENSRLNKLFTSDHPEFVTPLEGGDFIPSLFHAEDGFSSSTAVLSAPIWRDDRPSGLLLIEADQIGDFEEDHRAISSLYAELIGVELRQHEERSVLRSSYLFYSQLDSFQNDLEIERSREELITSAIRFCDVNFEFDKLTISLVDESTPGTCVVHGVSGFTEDADVDDSFPVAGTIHGAVLDREAPLIADNLLEDKGTKGRFKEGDLKNHPFLSFLGVPIRNSERVLGVLAVESFSPGKYDSHDKLNLQIMGERMGVLLGWWKNYEVVKEASMKDGLTGLLNRRAFKERFEEEVNRADRYQENMVLLVLDLDKFKRINDNHGHLYGDYVIVETADSMRNSVRAIDLVARYGGEEFAIVLINATKEKARRTCQRIVENIAELNYLKDGISVRMTISAGVAEFPSDGSTPRALIASADEAMYKAKEKGGDGVNFGPAGAS